MTGSRKPSHQVTEPEGEEAGPPWCPTPSPAGSVLCRLCPQRLTLIAASPEHPSRGSWVGPISGAGGEREAAAFLPTTCWWPSCL